MALNWRPCIAAVIAFTGCSKATEEPPAASAPSTTAPTAPPAASRPSPDSILVGVAREHGTEVCAEDGASQWLNRHWIVGFVPVTASAEVAAQLAASKGKIVVARGRVSDQGAPTGQTPPPNARPCPPAQMRSDWIKSIDGILIERGAPPLAGFAVSEVAPLSGLTARVEGDAVQVSFTNDLGIDIPGPVELTVHYEGCYGKPGSTSRTETVADGVANGASAAATFPTMADSQRTPDNAPGTARHRAASLQLTAKAPGAVFDLDVPLVKLGAPVKCPER